MHSKKAKKLHNSGRDACPTVGIVGDEPSLLRKSSEEERSWFPSRKPETMNINVSSTSALLGFIKMACAHYEAVWPELKTVGSICDALAYILPVCVDYYESRQESGTEAKAQHENIRRAMEVRW